MKCFDPIRIYYNLDTKKHSYHVPEHYKDDDCIFVPCGRCPACRNEWRTHLAQRMRYELLNYTMFERCFITLTVNEENLYKVFPGRSLDHFYFQKFIKRLRRYLEYHKIPHKPLKYLVCGEYGSNEGHRPHFHLILLGFHPATIKDDLYKPRRSKKGYCTYNSHLLEDLWGAGFVNVGDVSEHTAPYMVKYMCKYSEIPQNSKKIKEVLLVDCVNEYKKYDDSLPDRITQSLIIKEDGFAIDGIPLRKPYIVYPKKILGIDYFLENYKQILRNGYILDSTGKRHGIPRSFKKWCSERCEDTDILEEFNAYLLKVQILLEQETEYLKSLGYVTSYDRLQYYKEQGKIRRKDYESFKDIYR